jgi:hypothetical protein
MFCWAHARRLALSCALTIVCAVVATPSAAQSASQSLDDAIAATVREASAIGTEWLGPHPAADADLTVRRPLWQGPGAMFVEQQAAERVIRAWWPQSIDDAKAEEILVGFAWYLQSLAIERVFDRRYLRTAHSVETRSYFGDHVIWSLPTLRLSRHAVVTRNRYAAVFAALERWIGRPNLQGAMLEVARLPGDQLNATTIVRTISDAAGQNLSWAFVAVEAGDLNYAVTGLTSLSRSDCAAPCVDTTVVVTRTGAGLFSGRSAQPIGEFDSGDALVLKVTFADGSSSTVRWDGRDSSRTFRFRGPSLATAAYLDPDRSVTLDRNRLDNARVTPAPTNVPVGKWAARWLVWLQHTMLSYGFLA